MKRLAILSVAAVAALQSSACVPRCQSIHDAGRATLVDPVHANEVGEWQREWPTKTCEQVCAGLYTSMYGEGYSDVRIHVRTCRVTKHSADPSAELTCDVDVDYCTAKMPGH